MSRPHTYFMTTIMAVIIGLATGGLFNGSSAHASSSVLCKMQCGGDRCSDADQAQQCVDVVCKDLADKESRSILKRCQGALTAAGRPQPASTKKQHDAITPATVEPTVYVGAADYSDPCKTDPGAPLPPGYRKIQGAVLDMYRQGIVGGKVFVFDMNTNPDSVTFGKQIGQTPYRWIRWKSMHPKIRGMTGQDFDLMCGDADGVEVVVKDNDEDHTAEVACVQPGNNAPRIAAQALAATNPAVLPPSPPPYDPCNAGALAQGDVYAEGAIIDLPGVAPARKVFFFDPLVKENKDIAALGKQFGNVPLRYMELEMQLCNKPAAGLKTQYKNKGANINPVRAVVRTAGGAGNGAVACVEQMVRPSVAAIPRIIEPCDGNAILHPHYEVITGGLMTDDSLAPGQQFYFEAVPGHHQEGLGLPTGRKTQRGIIKRIAIGQYPLVKTVDGVPADYVPQQDLNHVEVVVNTAAHRDGGIGEVVCINAAAPAQGTPLMLSSAAKEAGEPEDAEEVEEKPAKNDSKER